MSYLIADTASLHVYASYKTEGQALRALKNALEKGWKIGGRKYHRESLEGLSVMSRTAWAMADVKVPVQSIMNPDGPPVMINKSQVGGPCDPSTERYWSM